MQIMFMVQENYTIYGVVSDTLIQNCLSTTTEATKSLLYYKKCEVITSAKKPSHYKEPFVYVSVHIINTLKVQSCRSTIEIT